MPARLAIAPVLVAWKPFAANSFTAASTTCSRRSSEVDLTAMPDRLLIDLSIVKSRSEAGTPRRAARAAGAAPGGARSGCLRRPHPHEGPLRRCQGPAVL